MYDNLVVRYKEDRCRGGLSTATLAIGASLLYALT